MEGILESLTLEMQPLGVERVSPNKKLKTQLYTVDDGKAGASQNSFLDNKRILNEQ